MEALNFGLGPDPLGILIRLVAAALFGALIGIQREWVGKAAGLRTHMLVALGAALYVVAPLAAGMSVGDLSRVLQGIVTGIGFIGGGTILKLSAARQIRGLTTAAGIWLTAAVGIAAALGELGMALLGAVLAWIVLAVLGRLEQKLEQPRELPEE